MLVKFTDDRSKEDVLIREVIHLELDCDVTLYFHKENFERACKIIQPKNIHKLEYNYSLVIPGVYMDSWESSLFKGYYINGNTYKFLDIFN